MLRKICPIGNSKGILIPKDMLETLRLDVGSKVEVRLDEKRGKILIEASSQAQEAGLDREFVSQVSGFIKRYGPALKALAKK
ncbi:MAG: AbrB/MazE/SpoVT family DNA-binding domain-containing protein [Deltaproteobacteria bacterium]|nr:AbrB/MazE/SpoVT family DNA-binding domain-containing protein [Deltaproteobacteria bacterium]